MKKEHALSEILVRQFIHDGYVRLDNAFARELAEEGRAILWKDTGCDPHDPATCTKPVIRLGDYAQEPFNKAVNTPVLHRAFDQLVGKGRWAARNSLRSFVIRFPANEEPGDTGWHVDASYPEQSSDDFVSWKINIQSTGRSLLMLFLFSDIGEADAPTRIRKGSHVDVARLLYPAAAKGMSFMELAEQLAVTENREEVTATGEAGTVYLCHPFLVHAGQIHHGTIPRFLAQPPLFPAEEFQLLRKDADYSPAEIAIRLALGQ
jgi:Phytanoyl-CoA dioxygenase (PhyH)